MGSAFRFQIGETGQSFGVVGSMSANNWYVLQIKPNGLKVAERNLERQGFNIFSPKRKETRRVAEKYVERVVPLFVGYVFVRFPPDETPWRKLNATRGVSRIIGDGRGYPAPLPEAFMDQLLLRCDQDGLFAEASELELGSEVRIIHGPFAQQVAQIEASDAKGRLTVLLEIMGQAVRAHIPRSSVEQRRA